MLALGALLVLAALACGSPGEPQAIDAGDLQAHVEALSTERMGGRATASAGARLAQKYITQAFRDAGLAPGGDAGGYAQAFDVWWVSLSTNSELRIDGTPLRFGFDWQPFASSKVGTVPDAGVVFAGHGIVAPADGEHPAWNDYDELDVDGKWVLATDGLPERIEPERRQQLIAYAMPYQKMRAARERGAVGLLSFAPPGAPKLGEVLNLEPGTKTGIGGIAAVSVSRTAVEILLGHVGSEAAGLDVPGVRVGARIDLERKKSDGYNVLGVIRATDGRSCPGKSPLPVVIGAHYDHLGRGEIGGARPKRHLGTVHPGADDNASGIAALIEIAKQLASEPTDDLARDVVFGAWSGEETGFLLGSTAFAPESGPRRYAAYLNMDMVGRLRKRTLEVDAVATSSEWPAILDEVHAPSDPPLERVDSLRQTTDTFAFYYAGVSLLGASTRRHEQWHTPSDVPKLVDYEGLAQIAGFEAKLLRHLARLCDEPDFQDIP